MPYTTICVVKYTIAIAVSSKNSSGNCATTASTQPQQAVDGVPEERRKKTTHTHARTSATRLHQVDSVGCNERDGNQVHDSPNLQQQARRCGCFLGGSAANVTFRLAINTFPRKEIVKNKLLQQFAMRIRSAYASGKPARPQDNPHDRSGNDSRSTSTKDYLQS
jgi:hypothetical protein